MKLFKYISRTSLPQIRADWSEYVGLWRQSFVLRAERRAARDKITVLVNGGENASDKITCIKQEYSITTEFPGRSSGAANDSLIYVKHALCKIFDKTGDSIKCSKSDCPCVKHNHEYIDACERYNVVRQARRDFWRVKFNQINQNVK